MKLIKLSADHYVIVDENKDIEESDYTLKNGQVREVSFLMQDNGHVITHSTTPLEYTTEDHLQWDKIKRLSLSEVKELIGEVDVENKAKDYIGNEWVKDDDSIKFGIKVGFVDGYNQALEDNKDGKYTEEDMRVLFALTLENAPSAESHTRMISDREYRHYVMDTLFSRLNLRFQPKTEWNVEFIDGKLKLK